MPEITSNVIIFDPNIPIKKGIVIDKLETSENYEYKLLNKTVIYNTNFDTEKYEVFNKLKMDSYLIDVFIEGAPSTQNIDIKIAGQSLGKTFTYTLKNNDLKTIDDIVMDGYIISNTERNYHREIKVFDKPMVKGILNGIVNLKNCGSNLSNMKIFCYREYDGLLIGKYPINSDGAYFIDNLDYNTFYDIHLVDTTIPKVLETQVSSHRQPTLKYPYNKFFAPKIDNEKILTSMNSTTILWNNIYEENSKIQKTKIYMSDSLIDLNNLKNYYFEYVEFNSYAIQNNTYKYFLIENIEHDTKEYGKVLHINDYTENVLITGEFNE